MLGLMIDEFRLLKSEVVLLNESESTRFLCFRIARREPRWQCGPRQEPGSKLRACDPTKSAYSFILQQSLFGNHQSELRLVMLGLMNDEC